jgi:hypothetical protein
MENIEHWDNNKVCEWLLDNHLGDFIDNFIQHQITGSQLSELNYDVLREMDIKSVKERARIIQATKKLFNVKKEEVARSASQASPRNYQYAGLERQYDLDLPDSDRKHAYTSRSTSRLRVDVHHSPPKGLNPKYFPRSSSIKEQKQYEYQYPAVSSPKLPQISPVLRPAVLYLDIGK